jgi:hypothetical protein
MQVMIQERGTSFSLLKHLSTRNYSKVIMGPALAERDLICVGGLCPLRKIGPRIKLDQVPLEG